MEEIERRSASPASKTVTSSRFSNMSNQESLPDSDSKESSTKKRSSSSKRKSRASDKENGEVNSGTNGDLHLAEGKAPPHGGEKFELKENNTSEFEHHGSEYHQNDVISENPEEMHKDGESNGDAAPKAEDKSVNGNAQINSTTENPKEAVPEEVSPKEAVNDSANMDTEESFFTAETDTEKQEGGDLSPQDVNNAEDNGNLDSEGDRENENGFEGTTDSGFKIPYQSTEQSQKTEPRKGFFGKWSFSLTSEKKEQETNGHSEDINTSQLYFSSIRGRVPLSRASPHVIIGESSKDEVIFRRGVKTPITARTLDDSFGVKSEPPRINRAGSKEKPILRKFPAKRCLADESDEKEDSFLTNLSFTKRRKLEDDKTRTGFLRSFLWSPFRKRNVSGSEDMTTEETEDKTTVAKSSWFRSPFWFWKRCNKEERN